MLLDVDNVIPYLVDRGHLSAAAVVAGGVRVSSASRRNRNLRLTRQDQSGYLLKQAETSSSQATLRTEASFYQLCAHDERAQAVRRFLPRLIAAEPAEDLLILELFSDAVPLSQAGGRFSASFLGAYGEALGEALGTCHRSFSSIKKDLGRYEGRFSRQVPWVLWVHRPGPEILSELSQANYKTLQILQSDPRLCRELDALRRSWQVETLVHGDIKADNLLLLPAPPAQSGAAAPSPSLELKLVDWELVQLGDPAWDLGGVFKDLLVFWISSMPVSVELSGARMAAQARWPLKWFQGAWRRMWSAYQASRDLDERSAADVLLRSVRYSAAYLLQAAYETAQQAAALDNHSVMMLQVSANILSEPAAAVEELFGIPFRARA